MKKTNLPANFLISLQKGRVAINCDNHPAINFTSADNIRTIDILDISMKISKKPGFIKQRNLESLFGKQVSCG